MDDLFFDRMQVSAGDRSQCGNSFLFYFYFGISAKAEKGMVDISIPEPRQKITA